MSRLFADVATDAEHHADLRAREEDLTPRGVVRAVLEALHATGTVSCCPNILDVCAGYGVWSSEARRLWPEVYITAVELDERKRPHIEKWADEVHVGDWRVPLDGLPPQDLAIGNPHFSGLVADDPDESMPALLLGHCRAVLLFHQEQSYQKSRAGAEVWRRCPPAAVFAVPGSVRFRSGVNPATGKRYGADSRCYQATLWVRGHRGPAELHMLPWLPAEARRWTVQPGTELPSEDLPRRAPAPASGPPGRESRQTGGPGPARTRKGERRGLGRVSGLKPEWVVNDLGELGVVVLGRAFFLYKGESLEYGAEPVEFFDGTSRPMRVRPVYKREFGECCHPRSVADYGGDWYEIQQEQRDHYTLGDGWGPAPAKGALDLSRLTHRELDELQVAIDAQRARGVGVRGA